LNIGQATVGKCFARWNSSSVSSRGAAADRLPDPEIPATNDLFTAEQQFAPVEKSQSIVNAARGLRHSYFVLRFPSYNSFSNLPNPRFFDRNIPV
jgi:hypothetical protein